MDKHKLAVIMIKKRDREKLFNAMQKNNFEFVSLLDLFPIKKSESGKKYAERLLALSTLAGKIKSKHEMDKFYDNWMNRGSYLRFRFEQEFGNPLEKGI